MDHDPSGSWLSFPSVFQTQRWLFNGRVRSYDDRMLAKLFRETGINSGAFEKQERA